MEVDNILWIFFNILCPLCVLLCVITCNTFFTIFRAYQASLPFPHPQHLIINRLFSHLSISWQASNIFSAFYILTELCFHLSSPQISCVLYYSRQLQLYSTTACIVLISAARFFANFWTDQYFNLPHQKIGQLCKWMTIAIAFFSTFGMACVCNEGTTCPGDRLCMDKVVKMVINICIIPVSFLNLAIIFDFLPAKQKSCFQFFTNFPNNSILPATGHMELQTISHTIDFSIQNPVTSQNSSKHNVTFTTGLITMVLATAGAGLAIKLTNIFGLAFYTSALIPCYSLIITTFISIYWIMANQGLKDFTYQVLFRSMRGTHQND